MIACAGIESSKEMLLDPPLDLVRYYAVTCRLCGQKMVSEQDCIMTANEMAYAHLRTYHTDWQPVYKDFNWDDDVLEEGK